MKSPTNPGRFISDSDDAFRVIEGIKLADDETF
jgi:hypothetical protein